MTKIKILQLTTDVRAGTVLLIVEHRIPSFFRPRSVAIVALKKDAARGDSTSKLTMQMLQTGC